MLDDLVREGLIRTYGWSADRPDAIRAFATSPGCGVVQQQLNVFDGSPEVLALCEELDLASINRSPLGMGILTGKYTPQSTFRDDDVRHSATWFGGSSTAGPAPSGSPGSNRSARC